MLDDAPSPASTQAAFRHAARATRMEGRRTRSLILDAANDLFRASGPGAVSIADIAGAAGVFPSQITYYFGTKEALFVEAACRAVLYVARAAETHAQRQLTPPAYTRALVESVMHDESIGFFVEAMVLTRRRPDLAALIARTTERLHAEGLRAYAATIDRHGWRSRADVATSARRFWAIAIGVAIEGQATGQPADARVATMLRLLGAQADTEQSLEDRP